MHLTLSGKHATSYQARDECSRLPGLLIDGRILKDVLEREGVQREQTLIPLRIEVRDGEVVDNA